MSEAGCIDNGVFNNLKVLGRGDIARSNYFHDAVAAGNLDYSADVDATDKLIMISAAKADATYIRLPEATTLNGGKHIRVIMGIALADDFAVGFVTTNIIGGATAIGDTDEANAPTDTAAAYADVGDGFKSVRFNLDTVAAAGGTGGTILDFYYTGTANLVVYRGDLVSEIDDPTLTGHFSATVVTS